MEIIQRNPLDLVLADYNPRKISEKDFKQLKKSLAKFECVEPIIVNKHEGREDVIVGGHQRLKAMLDLGWKEVPTIEVDLDLEAEKELNVRLNKNTGEFDFELLTDLFEIDSLIDIGFSEVDLGIESADIEDEPNYEELIAEEKNKSPTIKITFNDLAQLKSAEVDIQELIDKKYIGAYFSISAGEI